jgi:hypothetical protein
LESGIRVVRCFPGRSGMLASSIAQDEWAFSEQPR